MKYIEKIMVIFSLFICFLFFLNTAAQDMDETTATTTEETGGEDVEGASETVNDESAQSPYLKGAKLIFIGLGIGHPFPGEKLKIPTLTFGIEYGFHDLVSVGFAGALTGSKVEHAPYTDNYTYVILALRPAFHFLNLDNFPDFKNKGKSDLYAGLAGGITITTMGEQEKDLNYMGAEVSVEPKGEYIFYWGVFAGARYYIHQNIALYAEIGYGYAWLNLGFNLCF